MTSVKKIYGFYHICDIGDWRDIVDEQIRKLKSSGLYQETEMIYYTFLGNEPFIIVDPKFKCIFYSKNKSIFEYRAINSILDFCKKNNDVYVYYFHTKGCTRYKTPVEENCRRWRHYMEYYNFKCYQEAIDALETHDTCGTLYSWWKAKHYSGNFWWAKGDYIKKLKPLKIGEDRFDTEKWIMSENPICKNLGMNIDESGDTYIRSVPDLNF